MVLAIIKDIKLHMHKLFNKVTYKKIIANITLTLNIIKTQKLIIISKQENISIFKEEQFLGYVTKIDQLNAVETGSGVY